MRFSIALVDGTALEGREPCDELGAFSSYLMKMSSIAAASLSLAENCAKRLTSGNGTEGLSSFSTSLSQRESSVTSSSSPASMSI
jgi:hypothetical protein